jgi:hypothetical protein
LAICPLISTKPPNSLLTVISLPIIENIYNMNKLN